MERDAYPALYQAADSASMRAQSAFLRLAKAYFVSLMLGAGLGVYGIASIWSAVAAALVYLGATVLAVLMGMRRYENTWYRARAVAESVKTSTWRWMMKVEPYAGEATDPMSAAEFRITLEDILKQHRDLGAELGGDLSAGEQITERMKEVRSLSLSDRADFYLKHRIQDQRIWYAKKAKQNQDQASFWLRVLVALQACAIVLVILRIPYPQSPYLPAEFFAIGAGSVLTWMQMKRFRELSAAYGLAAHEIGILRSQLDEVQSETEFSSFVSNAENAFSREHTQWIARRD